MSKTGKSQVDGGAVVFSSWAAKHGLSPGASKTNVIEMDVNESGKYECVVRVDLRKRERSAKRRGPTATLNQELNNSNVVELIIYSPADS